MLVKNMRNVSYITLSAFFMASCHKAVAVDQLPAGTAPITTFQVRFDARYRPNSFSATLDGGDVTALFSMPRNPGGTAIMRLPDNGYGFIEGWETNRPPPPPPLKSAAQGSGPSAGPPQSAAGPSTTPSGSGTPPAGSAGQHNPSFTHRLVVSGVCDGLPLCISEDVLVFAPVHLIGTPNAVELRRGVALQIRISSLPAVPTPIAVRVRPSSAAVSLNGQAPGATILATIPPNGTVGFHMAGVTSGATTAVWVEANGRQRGRIDVTVVN